MSVSIRALFGLALSCVGTASAAELLPAELFSRHAEVREVALSPGGDYVALAVPAENGNETRLEIVKLDGSGQTQILAFRKRNHVTDVVWTSDQQVTVARAEMEPLKARPRSVGELVSADVQGKNQKILFAYIPSRGLTRGRRTDEGYASIVKVLNNEPGKALVSFTCWSCGEEPDSVIYKVDTVTGERREVERIGERADFLFDTDGTARIMMAIDANDNPKLSYRPTQDATWRPLPKSMAGYSIAQGSFSGDNKALYALVSDAGEPEQLYRLDLVAGNRVKLAGRDDMAVSYLMPGGHDGTPFAAVYTAAKPMVEYLDGNPEWVKLHQDLMKLFPGEMLDFVAFSRNDRKLLLTVRSDRHPGAYYVFDRDSHQLILVAEVAPWIDPTRMAPTRSIEFPSRDGRKLQGFYTASGEGTKPLVVLPHGGPHGVHDTWGYDPDVQFLASRGYGVLQVNFRGSAGRGSSFEKAGYREWGGKMQDDIADGVRWAIDNKLADPQRTCTFGASFGGYAALMQPIRYPELYQCAAGYVGVYDLTMMHKAGDIPDTSSGRRYLERVLGTDPAVLGASSPARNVDKIKVPVFLAQGGIDTRVPMAQFNAMKKAFPAGTTVETMVVAEEGHGFYAPENQAELYRRLEAFLDRNIGAASE